MIKTIDREELDRLAYSRKFVNRPLAIDCRFPPLVRIEPKPVNHKARAIEYLFCFLLCVAGWLVILWLGLHPHFAGDKALQVLNWLGF